MLLNVKTISDLVYENSNFQETFSEQASERLSSRFGTFLALIDSNVNTRNIVGSVLLSEIPEKLLAFAHWSGIPCRMQHHIPGSLRHQFGCSLQKNNPLCGHVEMELLIYAYSAWFFLTYFAGKNIPHPAQFFEKNAELDSSYFRLSPGLSSEVFQDHADMVGREQQKHLPMVQGYLKYLRAAYGSYLDKL